MEKFKVTFLPDNKTVEVEKDKSILSAALSCGVYINSVCGGDGVCGRCKVVLKKGKVITQPNGAISIEEKKKNVYLACITTVHSDLEVEVPAESRLDFEKFNPQEMDTRLRRLYVKSEEIELPAAATTKSIFKHSPFATKLYLSLSQPTLDDRISDLERLYRQVRLKADLPNMQTGLYNLKQLGELLRDSEWKVTVTLGKRNDTVEIVLIEPGDTSSKNFGLAFDIGTTTISGQLIDLNSKKILGTKGLQELHNAVTDTINQMIRGFIQEHNIDLNDVTCFLCAGNTTMIHLLFGIDPAHIRREPYVPTVNFLPIIRALEAGININPRGLLSCVPGVASYVGGDVTAGVLSCGLYQEEDLGILIDIGTNGEIVLGNKEFMVACAASAGPAFEGSGVACGMRASRGAIQKVKINPKDLEASYETIGEARPRGICGSGYIDLLAQMFKAGIIDRGGAIKLDSHKRIRQGESGREFIVAFKQESDSSDDIVISEADIENLKRAKAAIYSATAILIKHLGFDFTQVKKIFIAGGFGAYLDVESAVGIGLLPDLERSKFIFVGNSSLAGARSILLSYEAMREAEEIARNITYFELSVEASYMDEYMAALFFPHTDLMKFPSVKL
jgi:uncharacterized 2Fe-2S/4Fe-4S cluster protein (DUF4445 family)